jgi:hypothetical protein
MRIIGEPLPEETALLSNLQSMLKIPTWKNEGWIQTLQEEKDRTEKDKRKSLNTDHVEVSLIRPLEHRNHFERIFFWSHLVRGNSTSISHRCYSKQTNTRRSSLGPLSSPSGSRSTLDTPQSARSNRSSSGSKPAMKAKVGYVLLKVSISIQSQ